MPASTKVWHDPKTLDRDPAGRHMVAAAEAVQANRDVRYRIRLGAENARMFEGPQPNIYTGTTGSIGFDYRGFQNSPWNVLRQALLTLTAQITVTKPRPRLVTNGANQAKQLQIDLLQQAVDAMFTDARVYDVAPSVFQDCLLDDAGLLEVYRDGCKPGIKRVHFGSVFVDPVESFEGKTKTLYRWKPVERSALLAQFGKDKQRAKAIANAGTLNLLGSNLESNMIQVWEAWRLPSSPGEKDGRHCIAIASDDEGSTLGNDAYKRDYFPIFGMVYEPARYGVWGRPAAEYAMGLQAVLNALLIKITKTQKMASVARAYLHRGSKILPSDITNSPDLPHIEYTGKEPVFFTPQALPPEIYQWFKEIQAAIFAAVGVSSDAAHGTRPLSLNSGKALSEYKEQREDRHGPLQQRYETMICDVARAFVDTARDIYREDKKLLIKAPGTEVLSQIDWEALDLEEDWAVEIQPASMLPTTPAARAEEINRLVAAGTWTPERGEREFDTLDPKAGNNLEQSMTKDIERMLNEILVNGKYESPEDFHDPKKAAELAIKYICMARNQKPKVPRKRIDLLSRWLDEVGELEKKRTPPPAPMAAQPVTQVPVGAEVGPAGNTIQVPPGAQLNAQA